MPTKSLAELLLGLDEPDTESAGFWGWTQWSVNMVGGAIPPYDANFIPNRSQTKSVIDSIKVFANDMWNSEDSGKFWTAAAKNNYSAGQKAWKKWIRDNYNKGWKIAETLDRIMEDKSLDPYSVMASRDNRPPPRKGTPVEKRTVSYLLFQII